jgi:threonine dehydrogenase-like Zn-dependent dehydrogenase
VAVQLLKLLTNVRVIALDKPGRLGLAEVNGADDTVVSSPEAVAQVLDLTSGRGVDAQSISSDPLRR